MGIAEIKSFIEAHLAFAADELKAKFADVVAFVEGQESDAKKIAEEIADLTAKGYTVTRPLPPIVVDSLPPIGSPLV